MARNKSILPGNYFNNFINHQINTGKCPSASEVTRDTSRLFEHEKTGKCELINELKKGEKSGFAKDFNRKTFLENLHKKHVTEQ